MATFNVQMFFSMRCHTNGYTIEADTKEEALRLVESCISKDGDWDARKFEIAGGDLSQAGWDTEDGSDHDYEVTIDDITAED